MEIEKKVTINDKSTSYFNIFDYFGNYLSKIFDSDIPMQTRSFSKVLNHDQLCYLIIKSFQSRNYQSFISSVYKERKKLKFQNIDRRLFSAYLRFEVDDKPGILSNITNIFSQNRVSIKRLVQNPHKNKKSSSIIIVTHKSEDRFLKKTLKEVDRKNYIRHKSKLIRIDE